MPQFLAKLQPDISEKLPGGTGEGEGEGGPGGGGGDQGRPEGGGVEGGLRPGPCWLDVETETRPGRTLLNVVNCQYLILTKIAVVQFMS